MKTTTTSGSYSLNVRDLIKGGVMAFLVPVITIISQSVNAGSLVFNWRAILIAAISGFVGYIIKNFLSPATVVLENPSEQVVEAVKNDEVKVMVMPK